MPGYQLIGVGKRSGEQVDLRSVSPDIPEVSSFFLRIHASLCQVLHASGAAEVIDKILREWQRSCVLAEDGGDAALLSARLSMIPAC